MRKPAAAALAFTTIETRSDTRSLTERLADVLSESHREDTDPTFRLGLLQGALAIALPQLEQAEKKHPESGRRAAQLRSKGSSRKRTRPATKRSRAHA
jgi:hypothetical protein